MDNRDTNSPAVNHLAPDSLQGLLVGALSDAGIDIIAFDSDASVAFTTLGLAQEHRDALIQYARNHRDQASAGGRLLFTRDRKLFTLYPRKQDVGGHTLDVFTVRHRHTTTVRPGIDWLNAKEVRIDFEQSAFGIIEGEAALSPLVLASYEHNTPVMLEGEAGSGKDQIAELLYLSGSLSHQPFVRISCDILNDRSWHHLLKSADSPLYQTDMTTYIRHLHALEERRHRELLATLREGALTERCRVILSGNDIPGGGECDAVAQCAEQLNCAVCIAPSVREQGEPARRVERYLASLAQEFEMEAPSIEHDAAAILNAYSWPRNYAQLREVAERLLILGGDAPVSKENANAVLAQENVIRSGVFSSPALETDLYILRPLADTERDIAQLVVDHLGGNKTKAADVLGISRTTLWRLLR